MSQDPAELPLAVAELLDAQVVTGDGAEEHGVGTTTLRLPTPRGGLAVLSRSDEAFTPAETARAHRLAELAEIVEQTGRC